MPDSSTILLVDDEESIQTLLAYPLERDGYRVVQARDGEEALRIFRELEIDLVVLDLMLQKVDVSRCAGGSVPKARCRS